MNPFPLGTILAVIWQETRPEASPPVIAPWEDAWPFGNFAVFIACL